VTNPTSTTVYSSTSVGRLQAAAAVLAGATCLAVGIALGGTAVLVAALVAGIVVVCDLQFTTVRVLASADELRVSRGWGTAARVIPATEVIEATPRTLTTAEAFGVRGGRAVTRLTNRSGPALELTLRDGEVVCISTADPSAACEVLVLSGRDAADATVAPEQSELAATSRWTVARNGLSIRVRPPRRAKP
jgi:hypothetical protein